MKPSALRPLARLARPPCPTRSPLRPFPTTHPLTSASASAGPSSLPLSRALSTTPPTSRPTASPTSPPAACPSCHAPLPPPSVALCPACAALLPPPPPSASHFALFALAPAFGVDVGLLKRAFLQAQQKVHPDLFSGQGERERWAKGWSGRVNDGYKVLLDPRARGEYLLGLSDVRIDETDSVTEPGLLMEVMEIREALEDAETEEQVGKIRQDNKDKISAVADALSTAFASSPPNLAHAKNLLMHWKYLEKLDEAVREVELRIGA